MSPERTRDAMYFRGPSEIEIRREAFAPPSAGEVVVQSHQTAISAGTELLIYRGLFPGGLPADASLPALTGDLAYPLKFGYSAVGVVVELGQGVDPAWRGRSVFAFQPHQTHFVASVAELVPLPSGLSMDDAVFLPNTETAVSLVQDGRPVVGERVAVLGQGVVGLLTTALLASMPLARLVTVDRIAKRREASLRLGAGAAIDPGDTGAAAAVLAALSTDTSHPGADLTYELTGNPEALDLAIAATGDDGRIVIGSWYGRRTTSIDLGGRFHRSRIQLLSSQVSRVAPALSGTWSKARRLEYALDLLTSIHPGSLITHRIPFEDAAEAYRLLAHNPSDALQVVLTYPEP